MNDIPGLSQKLGINFTIDKSNTTTMVVSNGVATIANTNNTAAVSNTSNRLHDEEEDYKKSRELNHVLAEIGINSLNELKNIAAITNEPRAFEVIATLIKSLNETSKQMNEIHVNKKTGVIDNNPNGNVTIDKAVFVGSHSDLLKTIRNANTEPTT